MPAPTIEERFPSAATSPAPSEATRGLAVAMHAVVVRLADFIDATVPESRDKSIALTSLEDVLMRANRAIYAGGALAESTNKGSQWERPDVDAHRGRVEGIEALVERA